MAFYSPFSENKTIRAVRMNQNSKVVINKGGDPEFKSLTRDVGCKLSALKSNALFLGN